MHYREDRLKGWPAPVFVHKLKLAVSVCHVLCGLFNLNNICPLGHPPTLLSELLAPDPPLCPEAVYHRLLSCELRQQSCLVLLDQLKLQTKAPVLLHLYFQGMQAALPQGQRETIWMFYSHLSRLTDGKAAGSFSIHDVSQKSDPGRKILKRHCLILWTCHFYSKIYWMSFLTWSDNFLLIYLEC